MPLLVEDGRVLGGGVIKGGRDMSEIRRRGVENHHRLTMVSDETVSSTRDDEDRDEGRGFGRGIDFDLFDLGLQPLVTYPNLPEFK